MVPDRNQCDARAYTQRGSCPGNGGAFGRKETEQYARRHESGLISFTKATGATAVITVLFNFPPLSRNTAVRTI